MNVNKNHVIVALAAVATYNEVACAINGRRLKRTQAKYDALKDYTNILVDRLNTERITLDPFEKIVMDHTMDILKK